jgi:putative membrane protein
MMRVGMLAVGAVLLAWLWAGPLPEWASRSFTAHMVLHMGVVAVVAPLLAMALAGSALDPARALPQVFTAVPAAALELAVVWGWHAPLLHHFARHSSLGFVLEQGSFVAVGFLVWMASLGGERVAAGDRAGNGVIALLLTSMHMTLLGALLALTPRPLYQHGGAPTAAAALDDQQLGGAIMLAVGGVAYLAGGLWLSRRLLAAGTTRRAA